MQESDGGRLMAKARREPRYSAKEQRERMAQFERWVTEARESWRQGIAVVLLSYPEFLKLKAGDRVARGAQESER
jgi:hypothetical protein